MIRRLLVLALLVGSALGTASVNAAYYADDACPDHRGTAYLVDTAARAATVANGFNLPSCHLIVRTSLDQSSFSSSMLSISAKSVTIEGAIDIAHPFPESRIVLTAHDGDVVVAGARLSAQSELRLQCLAPASCAVTVHRGAHLHAGRTIRTAARGAVKVEDAKLTTGEMEPLKSALRP